MRDDYLTRLDTAIRLSHERLLETGETRLEQRVAQLLTDRLNGLLMAREMYVRPDELVRDPSDALADALEGSLLHEGPGTDEDGALPRRMGLLQFEPNRDHPDNLDLVTSHVKYKDGGWTLSNRTELSAADVIELIRVARAAIVNGKVEPQS